MATPDVRPVGELPDEIGKTAARELSLQGISSLERVADHAEQDLLDIHGVGRHQTARSRTGPPLRRWVWS